jgi:hypothetical protein
VGEVEDFMPVAQTRHGSHRQRLIRRVVAVRGRMHFELECAPRFDYGRERHTLERHAHGAFRAPSCTLALETELPIETRDGDVRASFSLGPGETATFILEHVDDHYEPHRHGAEETRELFECRSVSGVVPHVQEPVRSLASPKNCGATEHALGLLLFPGSTAILPT